MSDSFSRFLIKRMNKTPTEMTLKWETNGWWCIHIALIVVVNSIVRHTNIFKKAPNTQNNKQKANKTQKAHRETKQQQKKGRITRFVFGFVVTYIVCFFSLSTSRLWFYFVVVVVGCFFSVVRWCFFFPSLAYVFIIKRRSIKIFKRTNDRAACFKWTNECEISNI